MARRLDETRQLLELHSASSSFLSAFRGRRASMCENRMS